ncbi:MAG: NADH-quinone oxidoreductase subunit J [Magnetococcus sp. DMHC-6]
MVADFIFYIFAIVTVVAALGVVTVRNPVHSVMLLVLTFFTTAAIFVLLGAEFLAAILVMVYMGAVAILFLFVVMMLDVDFIALRRGAVKHLPFGIVVGLLILLELVIVSLGYHEPSGEVIGIVANVSNTMAIGQEMYTRFIYPFELASLILLVAIIGAIVLTLQERSTAKRQSIEGQLARRREETVTLIKVATGEGATKP